MYHIAVMLPFIGCIAAFLLDAMDRWSASAAGEKEEETQCLKPVWKM